MVSYPVKAIMKHTSQVKLLTEVKVSVTMNCSQAGHCVLHGQGGKFSKSRITVGAVKKNIEGTENLTEVKPCMYNQENVLKVLKALNANLPCDS